MKMRTMVWILALAGALTSGDTRADTDAVLEPSPKPIQLALVPGLQLVPEDEAIRYLRLNLYGRNVGMTGVDIGPVNETTGNLIGVEFGLVNVVDGEARGLQLGGIYSQAEVSMSGLQVGLVNRSASMHGVQIGLVNFADDLTGIQVGLWNEIKNREDWNVIPLINANF